MKQMRRLMLFVAAVVLAGWLFSLGFCEFNTWKYGAEFKELPGEMNSMIDGVSTYKIISYSDNASRVYYVDRTKHSGNILRFIKKDGEWYLDKWEKTVWSKTGSTDSFIWPYFR